LTVLGGDVVFWESSHPALFVALHGPRLTGAASAEKTQVGWMDRMTERTTASA
jgi:hypothetical protein